jgi:hypothetical protein
MHTERAFGYRQAKARAIRTFADSIAAAMKRYEKLGELVFRDAASVIANLNYRV